MRSSFKFLHAADVHLDSPLRGLERYQDAPVEALRGATRRAFENLARLAIDETVDFLVLAGDLYDGDWEDYNTGLFFTRVMRDLREANIPVFLLSGNHDAASHITRSLRLPENVHVFGTDRPQTFELPALEVALHGQGFATRKVTDNLAATYPSGEPGRFDIGVLHTSLDGREGHAPYAPCTLLDLQARNYDYWALGHVHEREIVAEDPWIVFPGNLQGRHARECGAKGAYLVTVDERRVRDVSFRPLDVARWAKLEVDVEGSPALDEVLDRVRSGMQDSLETRDGRILALRLTLEGATGAHSELHRRREEFVASCRAEALDLDADHLWLEKIELATRPAVDLDAARSRDDALGGLLRAIESLEEGEAFATSLRSAWGDLAQRLPEPVRDLVFDDTDPESREALLSDVKQLLVSRLVQREPAG